MNTETPSSASGAESKPTPPDRSAPSRRIGFSLEIDRAIILSLAALLTAWCGYQSTRWNGAMATHFSRANALRMQSAGMAINSMSILQIDLSLFQEWLNATARDDATNATYYAQLFRPEFRKAFDVWIAARKTANDGTPLTPFGMAEYQLDSTRRAEDLSRQADAHFANALVANQSGDNYTLNTVILAATLLLAGVADRFRSRGLHVLITTLANILLLIVIFNLLSYPIL